MQLLLEKAVVVDARRSASPQRGYAEQKERKVLLLPVDGKAAPAPKPHEAVIRIAATCVLTSSIEYHMRTHTGDKPFACAMCPYAARSSNDLRKHVRTHTGQKPYKCLKCPYAASQGGHLKRHMNLHPST
ncbi:hypothetical protein HPB49_001714 [Dermacentor silvarum]|uniref:Uncharacterized protein n=1 Tax=Dermacentor silvarum TaxID=543639 RepID=A0ACB8DMB0_DERSI|nr:hypothetical protein HPB49_001714 [Dermacentor silvarum]